MKTKTKTKIENENENKYNTKTTVMIIFIKQYIFPQNYEDFTHSFPKRQYFTITDCEIIFKYLKGYLHSNIFSLFFIRNISLKKKKKCP